MSAISHARNEGVYGVDFDSKSYDSCRAAAQRRANETGADFGVEKDFFGRWSYRRLPSPQYRYGVDLQCECVRPEKWVQP